MKLYVPVFVRKYISREGRKQAVHVAASIRICFLPFLNFLKDVIIEMANYPYVPYAQPYGAYTPSQGYMNYMQGAQQPVIQPATQPVMQTNTTIQPQSVSQPGFVCRPVASKAEAQAVPTDFQGNMLVMTDIANGAIYTKALDPMTGSAQFITYQRVPEQSAQSETENHVPFVATTDYAPFFDALGDQINRMNSRIDELVDRLDSKQKTSTKPNGKCAE